MAELEVKPVQSEDLAIHIVSIQKVFFGKILYKKPAILKHFITLLLKKKHIKQRMQPSKSSPSI